MDLESRDVLLGCHRPVEVFGTEDARELRRAFARLARAWQDDDEVTAHLRALFEQARSGTPPKTDAPESDTPSTETVPPRSLAEQLHQALHDEAISDAVVVLAFHHLELFHTDRDLLTRGLSVLVHGYGEQLTASEREQLQTVLLNPMIDLPVYVVYGLMQTLSTLSELERLRQDSAVPPQIAACLTACWGHPIDRVAQGWLQAAHALAQVDLEPAFHHLEGVYPGLFGRWTWLEWEMCTAAGELADVDLEDLPSRYISSRGRAEHASDQAWKWLWGWFGLQVSEPGRRLVFVGCVLFCFVMGGAGVLCQEEEVVSKLVGEIMVLFAFVPVLLCGAGVGVVRLLASRASSQARESADGPLDPLLDFASDHGLFPRELASLLHDRPALHGQRRAYAVQHAILRLDRCPWALLAVMTSAHVERVGDRVGNA